MSVATSNETVWFLVMLYLVYNYYLEDFYQNTYTWVDWGELSVLSQHLQTHLHNNNHKIVFQELKAACMYDLGSAYPWLTYIQHVVIVFIQVVLVGNLNIYNCREQNHFEISRAIIYKKHIRNTVTWALKLLCNVPYSLQKEYIISCRSWGVESASLTKRHVSIYLWGVDLWILIVLPKFWADITPVNPSRARSSETNSKLCKRFSCSDDPFTSSNLWSPTKRSLVTPRRIF